METFRFRNFPFYQAAKQLFKSIVKLSRGFSRDYWELADQMRRCSLSICLNIAEGSAKRSDKDFNRYLENSLGSIGEAVACLDVALSIGLITDREFLSLVEKAESIKKQLGGFSRKLVSSIKS